MRFGGKDRRRLKTGEVEGLRGGEAGDADLPAGLRGGGEGHVVPAGHGDVAVDLVGDDGDAVAAGKLPHLREGLAVPDLPHGILGIAEDHEGGLGIGHLPFQILKIHGVGAVLVPEGALQHPAAVVFDAVPENVVHRSLDEHVLVGGGELAHDGGESGHHAGAEDELLLFHGEPVAFPPPAGVGLIPGLRHVGVTEDAVIQPLLQRLEDLRRGPEVHVRHPHGQLSVLHRPFDGVRRPAVRDRVEIVSHAVRPSIPLCPCASPRPGRRCGSFPGR